MKDIDFDELDRAVSSVLGSTPAKDEPETTSTETTSAVPAAPAERPTITPPSRETETKSAAERPLAVARRGKFMDVMHPSGDMNPNASVPARTAPKIQPLDTTLSAPSVAEEPVAAPVEEPAKEVSTPESTMIDSEPAVNPVDELAEQPEHELITLPGQSPVDTPAVPSFGAETSVPGGVAPEPVDSPVTVPTPEATAPAEVQSASFGGTPLTEQGTPFLTDAKVEKRPLGSLGNVDAETAESSPAAETSVEDTQVPRELQSDVVGVESATEATEPAPSEPKADDAAATLAPSTPPLQLDEDDEIASAHPLFDTTTYHEPIDAKTAVKSHTAVWVWWLVGLAGCLLVGAGVGYFLFTAGL